MRVLSSSVVSALVLLLAFPGAWARPVVRNIRSAHEFDRLLKKHATETGLPVVVDFYSDSCGPCRMMAPIFKQVAGTLRDKAVFVKVDTNAVYELSQRYQIRSLPTFQWFLGGKKVKQEMGGIGEQGLRHHTDAVMRQAEAENVRLTLKALQEYYQKVDPSKAATDIETVHQKCVGMNKKHGADDCVGAAANQLSRRLRKKYGKAPPMEPRFTEEDRKSSSGSSSAPTSSPNSNDTKSRGGSKSNAPNLHLATVEQLQAELEKRQDEERDSQVESESEDEDEPDPDYKRYTPSSFPERMVIIGGGPAGLSAAIYAARAGLEPVVIAPSMGGQLQGKGVDVENYPGLHNLTGPAVVASMRHQAAHFGAVFEDDVVTGVTAKANEGKADGAVVGPLIVQTNATGKIETHTVVVATGADSNWLQVPGEWELRGGGVSSCAVCDGFLYAGQHVVVVGGGDTAMEDALVLARTSKSVTVIHRRDEFRASKVLANRVLDHPSITVRWNAVVEEIVGKEVEPPAADSADSEDVVDVDLNIKVVTHVRLKDTVTGEESKLDCNAVFVAIGHTPNTSFLKETTGLEFDAHHPGYLHTVAGTTSTTVAGVFAAGDVADSVYRQAITSAGSGAAAALDAERYLSEHGLGNEAAEMEAELLAELMGDTGGGGAAEEAYNAYDEAGGRRMSGVKESLAGSEL